MIFSEKVRNLGLNYVNVIDLINLRDFKNYIFVRLLGLCLLGNSWEYVTWCGAQ